MNLEKERNFFVEKFQVIYQNNYLIKKNIKKSKILCNFLITSIIYNIIAFAKKNFIKNFHANIYFDSFLNDPNFFHKYE